MKKNAQDKQAENTASDLISRMERETGQRIDVSDGNNLAMAGLFGAIAREIGESGHSERDDIAAGVILRHQISPQGQREEASNEILANLLASGMSPDEIKKFFG